MPAYSPGGTLNAFAVPPRPHSARTVSVHRLLRGLPGYLILFDPHAFVHERQLRAGMLPSQSEFCVISMHFTATLRIPHTSRALKAGSSDGSTGLSPAILPPACKPAYAPFKPNKSGERSHPPYYRGCWHGVSRCFFFKYPRLGIHPQFCPLTKEVYNA